MSPLVQRRLLLIPVLFSVFVLAACSSSGTGSGSSGTSTSAPRASVPAVGNATDLNTEPTITAATSPAPGNLETKDLVVGTGKTATSGDTVTVQYVGADYKTGKVFDASWTTGQPATFPLNDVVKGFEEGIVGMKVGGRREIVIPAPLGYGSAGRPPAISPNETLVFVVDLKSIS